MLAKNSRAVLRTGTGIFLFLFSALPHNQPMRSASSGAPRVTRHTDGGLTPAPDVPAQAATGNWMRP